MAPKKYSCPSGRHKPQSSLKPKLCASATLIQKTSKNEPKHGPKNGTAWRSHFWDRMHSLVKEQKKSTFTVLFLGSSGGTGEDRLWESKFYIPFQPQKWASNKSNSSVTSSCASCGFLWSRLESQSWNSFNHFPIVNRVSAGVPTPPDSGKTPQLKTSKLAQNCGKIEVLHLQPSYGICWSHEIETLPPM